MRRVYDLRMDASNAALIERFYAAFDRHDADAMAACYAPDATFRDPVFGQLDAQQAGAMWRMLTGRAPDLRVELVEHEADEAQGSARWIARYTFSQTGLPVVNDVRARFRFRDGLIVEHVDRFPFYRWARQALGTRGKLLGWTPQLRLVVLRQARAGLDRAMQERDGAAPAGAQDRDQ
jgi:ketosteroid isomerase-like protein